MELQKINILLTGAGAPGAAGILKCLWQEPSISIITVDADPEANGRFLNTDFTAIPFADDPSFKDVMLALCRENNIHVILPLVTKELIPLASAIGEFELAGARIIVSPVHSLEIANNKSRLYQFLDWRGIKVPKFRIVETVDQFRNAIEELGFPGKPVCFKPSVSNGSRGFRIMDTSINESHLLFREKPGSVYITKENAIRVLSSEPFPELLVSEYLAGDEYSVDCLADHGQPILIVPRQRKKIINGISVKGEFIKEESIIRYCHEIIRELQLHGNIGIQVKKSSENQFLLLEINPRLQGTVSSALGAGINFPLLGIKQALGLPIAAEELQVRWGTRFSRYWSEVFY